MDPLTYIESLIPDPEGWTVCPIALQRNPDKALNGLLDPKGQLWEAYKMADPRKGSKRLLKENADHLRYKAKAAYSSVFVCLDGTWWSGERFQEVELSRIFPNRVSLIPPRIS